MPDFSTHGKVAEEIYQSSYYSAFTLRKENLAIIIRK